MWEERNIIRGFHTRGSNVYLTHTHIHTHKWISRGNRYFSYSVNQFQLQNIADECITQLVRREFFTYLFSYHIAIADRV